MALGKQLGRSRIDLGSSDLETNWVCVIYLGSLTNLFNVHEMWNNLDVISLIQERLCSSNSTAVVTAKRV